MTREQKIFHLFAWFTAVVCVTYVILRFVVMLLPFDYWVTYYSIVPTKGAYKVGEQLRYISDNQVDHQAVTEYLDVVYCINPNNGEYEQYSTQPGGMIVEPRIRSFRPWNYSPPVAYPTTCYTSHSITLHPTFIDFPKSLKITGPTFEVYE